MLQLSRAEANPSPTIDISHSTLNICTETIAATTMRIVWPTTFVTLSDDEARVSGNVSLRSPRRQKVRDEGCLSTACTRSLVVVTESTGVTIASWHWYISFFFLFSLSFSQSVDQETKIFPRRKNYSPRTRVTFVAFARFSIDVNRDFNE